MLFRTGKTFFAQPHVLHFSSLIIPDAQVVALKFNKEFIRCKNRVSNFLTQCKLEDMMEEYFSN